MQGQRRALTKTLVKVRKRPGLPERDSGRSYQVHRPLPGGAREPQARLSGERALRGLPPQASLLRRNDALSRAHESARWASHDCNGQICCIIPAAGHGPASSHCAATCPPEHIACGVDADCPTSGGRGNCTYLAGTPEAVFGVCRTANVGRREP